MKNVLLLDAVFDHFTVAIGTVMPDFQSAEIKYCQNSKHANQMLYLMHQGLQQADLYFQDITHCIANIGPGPFTAIRTVQVILQALILDSCIQPVPVSTLDIAKCILLKWKFNLLVPLSRTMGMVLSHKHTNAKIAELQAHSMDNLQSSSNKDGSIPHTASWQPQVQKNGNKFLPLKMDTDSWKRVMTGLLKSHMPNNNHEIGSSIYGKTLHLQQLSGRKVWI